MRADDDEFVSPFEIQSMLQKQKLDGQARWLPPNLSTIDEVLNETVHSVLEDEREDKEAQFTKPITIVKIDTNGNTKHLKLERSESESDDNIDSTDAQADKLSKNRQQSGVLDPNCPPFQRSDNFRESHTFDESTPSSTKRDGKTDGKGGIVKRKDRKLKKPSKKLSASSEFDETLFLSSDRISEEAEKLTAKEDFVSAKWYIINPTSAFWEIWDQITCLLLVIGS